MIDLRFIKPLNYAPLLISVRKTGKVVVGAHKWITPPLEIVNGFFPQKEWISYALHELVLPLPGDVPTTVAGLDAILERNRLGI